MRRPGPLSRCPAHGLLWLGAAPHHPWPQNRARARRMPLVSLKEAREKAFANRKLAREGAIPWPISGARSRRPPSRRRLGHAASPHDMEVDPKGVDTGRAKPRGCVDSSSPTRPSTSKEVGTRSVGTKRRRDVHVHIVKGTHQGYRLTGRTPAQATRVRRSAARSWRRRFRSWTGRCRSKSPDERPKIPSVHAIRATVVSGWAVSATIPQRSAFDHIHGFGRYRNSISITPHVRPSRPLASMTNPNQLI